jgi:two-component system nitrate/nitrite response regulator NarL
MFPLKVLVADDHRLFRQGLISLMRTRPDLVTVVGEAESGEEAAQLAHQLHPDIILLDILMPKGDGLQAAAAIRRDLPEIAIIFLTSSELDEHLYEAIRLGASGYLLKNLDAQELFELIAGISRGEAAITRSMAARLLKGVSNKSILAQDVCEELTEREIEVLQLVARGASNPQIAEQLFITVNTVKTHLRNILVKLNLENRTQVATYAVQNRLVPEQECKSFPL